MKFNEVEIIGLGPVGIATASVFLRQKFKVILRDNNESKLESLKNQDWANWEPELVETLKTPNLLSFTNMSEKFSASNFVICVGTPLDDKDHLDLGHIEDVLEKILHGANPKNILIRSTLPLGGLKTIYNSFYKKIKNCNLIYMPEFLRTGAAIEDTYSSDVNVVSFIGNEGEVRELISQFPESKNTYYVTPEEAELVKYTSNVFHALKISFANEISGLASHLGADARKVLEIFSADKKLNISEKYLMPGAPFGGPCLKKEVHSLIKYSEENKINLPLLSSIDHSNEEIKRKELKTLQLLCDGKKVLVLGDGFKRGSLDSRNSVLKDQILKLKNSELKISDKFIVDNNVDIVIWGSLVLNTSDLKKISVPIYDYFSGRLL